MKFTQYENVYDTRPLRFKADRISDRCDLTSLTNPEYFRHIRTCPKPRCRERYLNHQDVLYAYGIIPKPPHAFPAID